MTGGTYVRYNVQFSLNLTAFKAHKMIYDTTCMNMLLKYLVLLVTGICYFISGIAQMSLVGSIMMNYCNQMQELHTTDTQTTAAY